MVMQSKVKEFHERFGCITRTAPAVLRPSSTENARSIAGHLTVAHMLAREGASIKPDSLDARVMLITEELLELMEPVMKLNGGITKKDMLVSQADAIADLLYVVLGTAVHMGVDIEPVFDEVHRSNMTKVAEKDSAGKIKKGPGYVPPDIERAMGI